MSGKQFGPDGPQDPFDPQGPYGSQGPYDPQDPQDRYDPSARDGHGAQDSRHAQDGRHAQGDLPGVGEQELKRLLHSAVQDLEPSPDSLEHLRRAVPARRQRRRHAVVGAAAALLLGGTSIPALLHVASTGESTEDRPANAASSRTRTPDGGPGGTHGEGTEKRGDKPSGTEPQKGEKSKEKDGKEKDGKGADGKGPGPGGSTPDPSGTMDVTSPVCLREQLGSGTAKLGTAEANGRVYGSFRVVNTSGSMCSVEGGGAVGAVAQGGAESSRIQVVDHTSGDGAPGLPDPATSPDQLVLKPGEAYVVRFAWVPAEGGGTSGCSSDDASPTPGPSQGTGGGEPAKPGAETEAEGGGQAGGGDSEAPGDGKPKEASVTLSHTPEIGEPAAAGTTIPDACAGTVYRTGPLAAQ